jgi:predicted enzyme related to lactoylglutathione lyase
MNVRAIDFVAIHVADMKRSLAFYGDILGVVIPPDDANHPMHHIWAELDTHPVTLALVHDPAHAGKGSGVALAVEDVAVAVAEVRAAGHPVEMDTFERPVCFMASIADPDGNILYPHHRRDGTTG